MQSHPDPDFDAPRPGRGSDPARVLIALGIDRQALALAAEELFAARAGG